MYRWTTESFRRRELLHRESARHDAGASVQKCSNLLRLRSQADASCNRGPVSENGKANIDQFMRV